MTEKTAAERPNETDLRVDWIVGSSHILRWRVHVATSGLPHPLPADRLIGIAGAPIWSKQNFDTVAKLASPSDHIGVLVPDFRFGNGICLSGNPSEPVMRDGFVAIEPKALDATHDRTMLARSIEALHHWHDRFGPRARYLFWCLFGRQVQDRLAGRHLGDGGYRHPVFDWSGIAAALPELDIVDLGPLLRMPMHEVSRLFIDSSSHPSAIGYRFLEGVLCEGLGTAQAYRKAVDEIEHALLDLATRISAAHGGKVLLTGRSAWLDTLARYMGATGSRRLADAGLVIAPLKGAPGQPSATQLLAGERAGNGLALIFSASGASLAPAMAQAFGTDVAAWKDIPHVDWESAAAPHIAARHETPRFAHGETDGLAAERTVRPVVEDFMVELGPFGLPSWRGLIDTLEKIAAGDIAPGRVGGTRIEGDVLLTDQGIAYLIGGNHSVLKFATGEASPTAESITNFDKNIAKRVAIAARSGAAYAHVIFPDKQSVLSSNFPYQPVHRLGDAYTAALTPALKPFVLYPADRLKGEKDDVFLPLDTHMTDHGSLAVLRMMLAATGIDAKASLERIRTRIVKKQRWVGDLARKLASPMEQEGILLAPDWPIVEMRSPGAFNDGMVDVVFSPQAQHKGTVLLFGDSYFRMMLRHFSAVFTQVVCLRTRFLHPEMIALIRPDVIFTGNAERYLSAVAPDQEAHAFSLYAHLNATPSYAEDPAFLAAWRAVTAPASSQARALFAEQGLPPRERVISLQAQALQRLRAAGK